MQQLDLKLSIRPGHILADSVRVHGRFSRGAMLLALTSLCWGLAYFLARLLMNWLGG